MKTTKKAKVNLHKPCNVSEINWLLVIEDAETEIRRCEQRIDRLRTSISSAREWIERGGPPDLASHNLG